MTLSNSYDLIFVGNYTKDTIITSAGTRVVDGGGFNYGAHVAAMMGLRTAAVTRLAREDDRVVEALVRLGVEVFPTYTPDSTELCLDYPTSNVDERVITVYRSAGAFTPDQVAHLEGKAFLFNASYRGEVGLEVIEAVRKKNTLIAADAQGFARTLTEKGIMAFSPWTEMGEVLSRVDIFKTDAVEAEALTGTGDIRSAAKMLADCGPREIVLTHRDGLLVLADGQYHEAPFRPRQLVGRSGRGDTCVASYTARRLAASPEEATLWAAAVTSVKMEAEGPIKKTVADVEELIRIAYSG